MSASYESILIDEPSEFVRRITLNRPDKRNAMNNMLRAEVFDALYAADADENVRVSIIRGAGPAFCSGYDLAADLSEDQPWRTAGGEGQWVGGDYVRFRYGSPEKIYKPIITKLIVMNQLSTLYHVSFLFFL